MKNRGLTIIELLAFIIVLGIIIYLVFPKLTGFITDSRKETMIQNAEIFLDSVKKSYYSKAVYPDVNQVETTSICDVSLASGGKSPYGAPWDCGKSFVSLYNSGDNQYLFLIQLVDENGNALPLSEDGTLHENSIVLESDGNYPTRSETDLLIMKGKIGDYVNYDAGIWTENLEIPSKIGSIGGVVEGASRSSSVSCTNTESNLSGWRILSKRDGKVTLISAGTPLCYYHGGMDNAYTSEQYLKGNLDWATQYVSKAAASEMMGLSFDEFKNDFAVSTSIFGKKDLLNFCEDTGKCEVNKNLEGNISNISDSDLFQIGVPYYLASSKDMASLWAIDASGKITSFTDVAQGIRVLITLDTRVNSLVKDENGAWILS